MMLHLIEESLGREVAIVVADMCIHKRASGQKAPQKSSLSVALGSRNLHLISAIQVMTETVEEPLPLVKMCEILKISRRQLERLFKDIHNNLLSSFTIHCGLKKRMHF